MPPDSDNEDTMTSSLTESLDPKQSTQPAPTAIVTGGSQGLGRTIGEHLVGEGYRVISTDLHDGGLPGFDGSSTDAGLSWLELDVTNHAQVGEVFDQISQQCGGIDAVVANAGIQRHRALVDLSWQEWSAVIDVNLHGVFSTIQAAGRNMLATGGGSIVAISSVSARGSAGRAPYSTSKAAIIALVSTAAGEWASQGVRVNAVAPGYIDTGVLRDGVAAGTLDMDVIMNRIPANRLAQPTEIAQTVKFLLSEQSSYVTGQTLYVDGGFMIDYGIPLAKKPD